MPVMGYSTGKVNLRPRTDPLQLAYIAEATQQSKHCLQYIWKSNAARDMGLTTTNMKLP